MKKITVGDWVIVKRGVNVGAQGEVIDEFDPLDGGAPILTINATTGGQVDVAADRVERLRRP